MDRKPIAPQIVIDKVRERHGTGINGLINYRATFANAGIVVFGQYGQGVRSRGARLDLTHPALVIEEHLVFGAKVPPTTA